MNMANISQQTTWGSRANADASDSARMIRQPRAQYIDMVDEKVHEKLLLNDEMRPSNYDQKHYQPPTA